MGAKTEKREQKKKKNEKRKGQQTWQKYRKLNVRVSGLKQLAVIEQTFDRLASQVPVFDGPSCAK